LSFGRNSAFLLSPDSCLFLIQSVKSDFRNITWYQSFSGNKTSLFVELLYQKLGSGVFDIFSDNAFFPIYYRANQGFNIGLVMRRIPANQDFDHGSKLIIDVAAS